LLALSTYGLLGIAGAIATGVPASATVSAGGFVGVTPNRLLDTREIGQQPCVSDTRNLTVAGGATTVPTGARAVALNVAVVSPLASGYLTVFPAGAARPTASNLNYLIGEVVPNGVYVKLGALDQISIYASRGCPNVIVDVLGYFEGTTPVAAGGFVGLTPNRLLDTREPAQQPCVTGIRALTVTGGVTNVPEAAAAVSLNVTVASPLTPGFVTVYPSGGIRPTASNVNYTTRQVVPNNVTVKVGAAGAISIYASGGCPHVIVDVVGYYQEGTPVLEGGFVGVTPKRLVDTRESNQDPCLSDTHNLTVTGGRTTVPEGANAVAINVTVVSPVTPGYLTVFPAGATRPTASTLNYVASQVVPNGTVVKVGADGAISLYSNSGCPYLIVDVVGYYQGPPPIPAIAIAAGRAHSCELLADGRVACWGFNSTGQLGDGTIINSSVPLAVKGISTAIAIAAGFGHSCALLLGGAVKCWGDNGSGQLGDGTTTSSSIPASVNGISTAIGISAGYYHTCALLVGGRIRCWGSNGSGQLGDGTLINSSVPVSVTGITSATSISAGGGHSCALLAGGAINCWGFNRYGQLGDGTSINSSVPVSVTGITTATAIAAGDNNSCAVLGGGTVSCWGYGYSLLDDVGVVVVVFVVVVGVTTALAITAGFHHSCALIAGGTVKCWGSNIYGQLGDGTTTNSNPRVLVVVSAINTAIGIAAGYHHTCAVPAVGQVKCWGENDYGQLGNGTIINSSVPVSVISL